MSILAWFLYCFLKNSVSSCTIRFEHDKATLHKGSFIFQHAIYCFNYQVTLTVNNHFLAQATANLNMNKINRQVSMLIKHAI